MSIELGPISATEALARAAFMARRSFGATLGLLLLLQALAQALLLVVGWGAAKAVKDEVARAVLGSVVGVAVVVGLAVVFAGGVAAVAAATWFDRRVGVTATLWMIVRAAARLFPLAVVLGVLCGVMMAPAANFVYRVQHLLPGQDATPSTGLAALYLGLILVALYVSLRIAYMPPAAVLDRAGDPLGAAWRVSSGALMRTAGVVIGAGLVSVIVMGLMSSVLGIWLPLPAVEAIRSIGDGMFFAWGMMAVTVLYFDRRMREEGLAVPESIELLPYSSPELEPLPPVEREQPEAIEMPEEVAVAAGQVAPEPVEAVEPVGEAAVDQQPEVAEPPVEAATEVPVGDDEAASELIEAPAVSEGAEQAVIEALPLEPVQAEAEVEPSTRQTSESVTAQTTSEPAWWAVSTRRRRVHHDDDEIEEAEEEAVSDEHDLDFAASIDEAWIRRAARARDAHRRRIRSRLKISRAVPPVPVEEPVEAPTEAPVEALAAQPEEMVEQPATAVELHLAGADAVAIQHLPARDAMLDDWSKPSEDVAAWRAVVSDGETWLRGMGHTE